MPIRANCPSCKATLNIPDDVAGHVVQCTGCTTTFTAPAVAAPAFAQPALAVPGTPRIGSRIARRNDDEIDDEPRSRRRRREDDDSDLEDRPIRKRRPARKKDDSILPFVLAGGGLLVVVLIGLGLGAYYLFFNKSSNSAKAGASSNVSGQILGGNSAQAPGNGMPFEITSGRKTTGRFPTDSGVEIEFTAGPGVVSMYTLMVQSGGETYTYDLKPFETTPGQHRLALTLTLFGPRFARMGGGGGMEVWIEERRIGAFGGGGRIVSNKWTVN